MKIEMKGQGSDAFHREVVNIISQYRNLMKKPQAPLTDYFVQMKRNVIISAAMFAVLGVMTIMWGAGILTVIALTLCAVNIAFCASHMINLNRSLRQMQSDDRKTALILDDNGVAVEKDSAQKIKIPWEDIAFIRAFPETIAFFSGKTAAVITANREYEGEILPYLKEKKPEIRVIQ